MFPGLFAEVRIPLGPPKPGLVVPDAVVLSDQQGDYVFVVNAQNVVERRNIVKARSTDRHAPLKKGLTAEDRVVVNGIPNIRIGQTVQVTLAPDSVPAASPAPSPK